MFTLPNHSDLKTWLFGHVPEARAPFLSLPYQGPVRFAWHFLMAFCIFKQLLVEFLIAFGTLGSMTESRQKAEFECPAWAAFALQNGVIM